MMDLFKKYLLVGDCACERTYCTRVQVVLLRPSQQGGVDYLIDDHQSGCSLPIEVKSGKDYTIHSALNNFISNPDYNIQNAYVLSNEREIILKGKITYLPIYFVMFIQNISNDNKEIFFDCSKFLKLHYRKKYELFAVSFKGKQTIKNTKLILKGTKHDY